MSLKKYALKPTSALHLRDGNDELMYADGQDGKPDLNRPMLAHLYGPGTKQYAKAKADQSNRNVDKLKKKGKSDQTAEEQTKETATFLAQCTESFENVEYEGLSGRELIKAVYSDLELCFVTDQVNRHIAETANFTGQPATI
ncbi:MAG: hypothetical protein K2X55_00990 [Burkholderiaceae bacterium]|nr:hypothetical protein [Burkholderiaceae bacterium]